MLGNTNLVDSQGRPIKLGKELGRGGEGSVYDTLPGDNNRVVKIYHNPLKPTKQEKLKAMVRVSTNDLLTISTWPIDTVHDAFKKQVVGFLMPKMIGYQEIHELYGPAHRRKEFPSADWTFLIFAARNTAAAIAKLHSQNHVIGDINPKNVVVSQKAEVKLIDCDSFQITSNSQRFLCEVGVPHFTPPELHSKNLASVERTPNHDNFGLALLCFHLLFMGRHPFAGVFDNASKDMPIEQAICEFRFAYSSSAASKLMRPPPNSPPFLMIPNKLQHMFEQAFAYPQNISNKRPAASEWLHELELLRNTIRECSIQPAHKYHRSLSACPWCSLESQLGNLFFNPFVKPKLVFDLNQAWNRITIVVPLPAAIAQTYNLPSPIPQAIVVPLDLTKKQIIDFLHKESRARNAAYIAAVKRSKEVESLWAQHVADKRFNIKISVLQKQRDEYQSLKNQYAVERQNVERQARALQLQDYLKKHYISKAKISGIGQVRVANLASFGIETAADVTQSKVMAVPGIGPTTSGELVAWRNTLEGSFTFNPSLVSQLSQLVTLQAHYNARLLPLEKMLLSGPEELENIKQDLLINRESLVTEKERSSKAVAQTKIDRIFAEQELYKVDKFRSVIARIVPVIVVALGLFVLYFLYSRGTLSSGIVSSREPTVVHTTIPQADLLPTVTPTPASTSSSRPISPTNVKSFVKTIPATVNQALKVRKSGSSDEQTIEDLRRDDEVELIGKASTGTWCRIRLNDGRSGWVYCGFLSIEAEWETVPIIEDN